MSIEIIVPTLGESVTEATVGQWLKKKGESFNADEPLVELETDKVAVEVPAPQAGTIEEIIANEGDTVEIGAILATIVAGAGAPVSTSQSPSKQQEAPKAPAAVAAASKPATTQVNTTGEAPSVSRIANETGVDPKSVSGTGKDGRVTKGDMLNALSTLSSGQNTSALPPRADSTPDDAAREERVRMTKLRQTIATRLKQAQSSAAMLTTFNEVDLTEVMAIRNKYKDMFEKKHGVKLGFMSFFVKAAVHALQEIPAVNAEIDGTDIIYKNYYHIGVAVGTDKGLVVPVVRDAQDMSFAGIEKEIGNLGKKARDGKLGIADMQGGTFTISNGGVYGSLMSTPILNAPQSAILGMHKIQERPMVIGGEIKIRPMMYLALSYDHRIIDGKEAVTFLVRIKDNLEDPSRLLMDL